MSDKHWLDGAPRTRAKIQGRIFYANVGDLEKEMLEFTADLERETAILTAEKDELRRKNFGLIQELAAAVDRAQRAEAERDALKVDAERYRWLRDQRSDDGIAIVMKNKHIDDAISYPSNIDNYIDAARSMEKS